MVLDALLVFAPPPRRWHPWHLPLISSPCLLLPGRGSILVIFPWAGRHLLVCVCDPVAPSAPMVPDFLRGLVRSATHYLYQVLNVTLSEQEIVHVPQIHRYLVFTLFLPQNVRFLTLFFFR